MDYEALDSTGLSILFHAWSDSIMEEWWRWYQESCWLILVVGVISISLGQVQKADLERFQHAGEPTKK